MTRSPGPEPNPGTARRGGGRGGPRHRADPDRYYNALLSLPAHDPIG